MLDAVLIKECAEPSLKPAIVEQFVQEVGSTDPLAITVTSGGRLILVPKPETPEEAIAIVRKNMDGSLVRVGLTQFPAGIGVDDASDLKPGLFDPCSNLRMGTAMFARILRIVGRWYGHPAGEAVFPELFDDAVHACKTGEFEGEDVFQAEDADGTSMQSASPGADRVDDELEAPSGKPQSQDTSGPGNAGIRVDLTRIGGRK